MIKENSGQDNSGSPSSQTPANWASDTFTGSASGHTGHFEIRWRRSGNTLSIETLRYMITGDGSRNTANINIIVHAHYGKEWKHNSPDDRKQDGIWHTWDVHGTLDLGSATRITVKVVIIFALGGPDDRRTIIKEFNV